MRTLHLFAGAGGGLLADLILGHRPIGAVELDPYCCAVLRERAADEWFPDLRVHEQDIRLFDPSEYAGRVDCVSGGFPCQDISAAGRGAGITGERSGLWSEFARVIREVRPRYAFIENSPMLTLRGLDVVLSDIAAMGFDAEWAVVSAADAGAPHLRERIWILANSENHGAGWRKQQQEGSKRGRYVADAARIQQGRQDQRPERERSGAGCESGNANIARLAQRKCQRSDAREEQQTAVGAGWWQSEPDVGRVADEVANRVHRLKALGNGQVPQQAALAWKILMERTT